MQLITRVIRDQQDTTFFTRTRRNSSQHLLHAWTGKDVATCYGCEEAIADISRPGGFVTAAAAGDESYVGARGGAIEDDAVGGEEGERWVGSCERGEEAGNKRVDCCFGEVVFG